MRIAFISDVHGNIDALRAVIKDIKNSKIDKVYSLGDYLGYFYHPNACLNALKKINCEMIKGNHEDYYIRIKKNQKLLKRYIKKNGNGIRIAIKDINKENYNLILNLKNNKRVKVGKKNFLLFHGTPKTNKKKIFSNIDKKLLRTYLKPKIDYYLYGHTHRKTVIDIDGCKFINPGSVGQPRDNSKGASWVIYDVNKDKFIFKNSKYKYQKIKKEISIFDNVQYNNLTNYLN
jgi:putative phosphoesterase